MLDYHCDYYAIHEYIDIVDVENREDVQNCCEMLNLYWSNYCEVTKTYFYLITFTKTDDHCKKLWTKLRNKLFNKIEGNH